MCVRDSKHWFTASFLQGGGHRKAMLSVCYVCVWDSKHWFTASFLQGGRCRKEMLSVCYVCVWDSKHWFTASFLQGGGHRKAMLSVCYVCVWDSKHWFTASFLQGGRCRKEMLGVCVCARARVCEDSQRLPSCVLNPLPAKEFVLLMQFPRRRVSQRSSCYEKSVFEQGVSWRLTGRWKTLFFFSGTS